MKRKYQSRLNRVFLGIAAVLLCVFVAISGIVSTAFFRSQNRSAIGQAVRAKNYWLLSTTETIQSFFITMTGNAAISSWDYASSRADYYYYSAQAYQVLNQARMQMVGTPFYPTILKLKQGEMLAVSSNGSSSISHFFKNETRLSQEQSDALVSYFLENSGAMTLPVYDETGALSDLYYTFKKPYGGTSLVYFLSIPLTSLMGFQDSSEYFIYNEQGILASSSNAEETMQKFSSIYDKIIQAPDDAVHPVQNTYSTTLRLMNLKSTVVYLSDLALGGWKIAYVYNEQSPYAAETMFYTFIALAISSLLLYLVFRRLSHWLYQPFERLLEEWAPQASGGEIDEFKLMQQQTDTVKRLSQELQTTMQENSSLVSQKFYRELLLGLNVSREERYQPLLQDHSGCCVALFEFHETENEELDSDIFFIKSALLSYAQKHDSIAAVNITHERCALILKAPDVEQARELVQHICSEILPNQEFKVALSPVCTDVAKLHEYYRQACSILEYKYLYSSNSILTPDQVPSAASTGYSYPIVLENRLIHQILKGDSSCIRLIDELIRDNFENTSLSQEAAKSFVYALLGTTSRIFQELKISCEELLSLSIDYEKYYECWNDPKTIAEIRSLLVRILDAVQKRNRNSDNQMLESMKCYVYNNYSRDISLNDIADSLFISPKYCSTLFKKLSNDTFKSFLNHYRIEQAQLKMEQNPNIKIVELSQQVGFNSSNAFIRVFSKYTGMTPGAYCASIKEKTRP